MTYTSSGAHRRPIPSSFRKIQAAESFNKAITFKSESSGMTSWLTWTRPSSYIGTSFSRSFSSTLPVNDLTITLRIRFEQWGVQPDLDDAIELRQDALGFCALRPS
ncbi:hypothetical protein BDR04DRAFT_1157034 [Suillus decipiens]|nr:hypothetical protein BDR04DRAFT_1157034 [Suillus decipiens]